MTVFTCGKSGANTIFKPGIVKGIANLNSIPAVIHRYIITAAELMQQIGLSINDAFAADLFADIESDTSDSAFDPALAYFDTITGSITVTAQIA